ncbi:MAG: lipocalin family protein, partial [Burkholderiales bacterium]|nr:lipocalin family protein [Burkholderiales bacterium]
YWILYTDYNYSLVGSPNHKYLWILSRTENPESADINKLLKIATQQGFDISQLHYNKITLESK